MARFAQVKITDRKGFHLPTLTRVIVKDNCFNFKREREVYRHMFFFNNPICLMTMWQRRVASGKTWQHCARFAHWQTLPEKSSGLYLLLSSILLGPSSLNF